MGRQRRAPQLRHQRLVRADEPPHRRRLGLERALLAVQQVRVKAGRPPHGLRGVVREDVEPPEPRFQVAREQLDARRVAQVEAVELEALAPLREVGLGGVAARGVAGKARGGDHAGARAEHLQRGLVTDLQTRAGDDRDAPVEPRGLRALLPVERGARRAHRVVEEVHAAERDFADVAIARLEELRAAGCRLVVRAIDHRLARRREQRCPLSGADAGREDDARVVSLLLDAIATAQRLREANALVLVGPGDAPRRLEQRAAHAFVDARQHAAVVGDGAEHAQRGGEFGVGGSVGHSRAPA